MKGFGIEIKNTLLDPKHVEKMSVSVWLYMWLVDKMTSIDENGIGKVLGGRPIKYEEIKKELGISQNTYTRWMTTLLKYPYIQTILTPYGIVFRVLKAHKHFRKSPPRHGEPLNSSGSPDMANLLSGHGEPNNTISVREDINKDIQSIFSLFKEKICRGARLTEQGRQKILSRLKEYSTGDLVEAIDCFSKNRWWMEHNRDRNVVWFFRSEEQIARFLLIKPDLIKKHL